MNDKPTTVTVNCHVDAGSSVAASDLHEPIHNDSIHDDMDAVSLRVGGQYGSGVSFLGSLRDLENLAQSMVEALARVGAERAEEEEAADVEWVRQLAAKRSGSLDKATTVVEFDLPPNTNAFVPFRGCGQPLASAPVEGAGLGEGTE